jgi:hypothetical protein
VEGARLQRESVLGANGYKVIPLQRLGAGREIGAPPNVLGGGNVSLSPGPGWQAIGTSDFNGDGHSDILFQNTSSVAIWEMNGANVIGGGPGTTVSGGGLVSANAGPGWKALGLT